MYVYMLNTKIKDTSSEKLTLFQQLTGICTPIWLVLLPPHHQIVGLLAEEGTKCDCWGNRCKIDEYNSSNGGRDGRGIQSIKIICQIERISPFDVSNQASKWSIRKRKHKKQPYNYIHSIIGHFVTTSVVRR